MRNRLRESCAALAVWVMAACIVGTLVWILADIAWRGVGALSWEFLFASPSDAGRAGGIAPVLVSTLLILLVCLGTAVPIGLGTAVLLADFTRRGNRLGRMVRWSLDALAAVPSIVFGLFGNAFFCQVLGMGFSILSGGLTLACMALPLLIRTTEQALRAVPDDYRQGAAALGLSRTTTLRKIIVPAAAQGVSAGIILGMGRALAETAALIFTAGYVTRMPESLFDSGRALSVHIYDLSLNVPGGNQAAYGTALVLVAILMALNMFAMDLTRRWSRRRVTL